MTSRAKQFYDLIHGPEILVVPGVFDGFSARLIEQLGFKAGGISGAGLSESKLGWADVGIMGYSENVHASGLIASAVSIPVTADADTGYGNAINAYYTVKGFEKAGVASVMIEDQTWPKRCGHMAGKEVISAEEGVEKIRAAAEAKTDPHFVIRARTDSTAIYGVKEAIRRLNLYAEAGADLLFADALLSKEDIATVARNVSKPLSVNMGFGIRSRPTTPLIPARELQELGVKMVTYPRMLSAAALQGMKNALAAFMKATEEGVVIDRPDLAVSFEEINDLMGLGTVKELEKKFLTSGQFEAKYARTSAE